MKKKKLKRKLKRALLQIEEAKRMDALYDNLIVFLIGDNEELTESESDLKKRITELEADKDTLFHTNGSLMVALCNLKNELVARRKATCKLVDETSHGS